MRPDHSYGSWKSRLKLISFFRLFNRSVQPSSVVQAFDPLCEVQSDKASVEITSPYDGVVKELLVKEGEVAKVGEALCVIEAEDESIVEPAETLDAVHPVTETNGATTLEPPSNYEQEPVNTPKQGAVEKRRPHPLDPDHRPEARPLGNVDVLATPSVRHFARQNSVDLTNLAPGSGKGGRIEKKDVEAYLSGASSLVSSTLAPETSEAEVVVELGRTRYSMYKAMTKVSSLVFSRNCYV